ncbi:MAG: M20 family metallopeptidase [Solirubrobacterales bacterium]
MTEAEQSLLAFAKGLVATPSPPAQESEVATLLARELDSLGYRDISVDEVGNVVAWLGEGPPRLMFNGHMDHVPPGQMESPYEAEVVDGAAYGEPGPALRGRGSCDMKANLAAGAYAAAFLNRDALRRGSYVLTADVQEEIDAPVGIQRLLDRGLRADCGISGESTGLAVSVGHRGKARFELAVSGRSSHASNPKAGLNAVFRAVPFLQAVSELAENLGEADSLYGAPSITVTGISSEPAEAVAVVPGTCTVRIDRRYVLGEDPESCLAQLEALVKTVSEREGVPASVSLVDVYPLMTIEPTNGLVEVGREAVAAVLGQTPITTTWQFGVNATYMSAAGIPTIGIGPGDERWAHTDEEHVPLDEVLAASRIYAELIERLTS